MFTILEDNYQRLKEHVINSTKDDPEKWITYSINAATRELKIPRYRAQQLLSVLRTDPEILYKPFASKSRFDQKSFRAGSIEEKIAMLGKVRQFPILEHEEEKAFIAKTSSFNKDPEKNQYFYALGIFLERLKYMNLDREWVALTPNRLSLGTGYSAKETANVINDLLDLGFLKKWPMDNRYFLVFSKSKAEKADKKIAKYLSDNNIEMEEIAEVENEEIPEVVIQTFEELTALNDISRDIGKITKYYNLLAKAAGEARIKLKDLAAYDEMLKKQKITFARLSETYNQTIEEKERLEQKYLELSRQYAALDRFEQERTLHIESSIDIMNSELLSLLENYVSLPTYKKNEVGVNSKFKADVVNAIIRNKKQIIDKTLEKIF